MTALLAIAVTLVVVSEAAAETPALEAPGRWKLETLTLADGTQYRGLVQSQNTDEIDFAEIVQPPGKAMYAVVRGVPRSEAARLEMLDEGEHAELLERFARFRNRAVIEAGQMGKVELSEIAGGDSQRRSYAGPWFTLLSTADDEHTRRCVVRIEQMFRAYRTLLPPKTGQPTNLSIHVYGSLDDYRLRLRSLDLALDNAAFYSPREATIFAGSDLNRFAERLAQVRGQHEQVRERYARLDGELNQTLAKLRTELKKAGFSDGEATAEIRQRRATWKAHMEQALAANTERERTNERKFAEVTDRMFSRLYHEAFHAYLGTFVFPEGRHHVPRWINEGLAQVFETGQLDGDSLRIDAPDRTRLARLQADLAEQPLPLAQLLTAEEREFLGPHGSADTERHYLYAWGLAWHLAFQENLLATDRLQRYVAAAARDLDPVARFERLTGQSLAEFEPKWRAAMAAQ
jgi:hypothetical protein